MMAALSFRKKSSVSFVRTKAGYFLGISILGSVLYFFASNNDLSRTLNQTISVTLFRMGFVVRRLVLPEQIRTTQAEILHALQLKEGSPLFDGSLPEKQARLESLPWVKTASIQRFLQGTVQIHLTERTPVAIFHDGERQKFVLLDSEGVQIHRPIVESFRDLPVVSGEKADQKAPTFLKQLSAFPVVQTQASSLVFVHQRRWNLRLKSKVEVKLPEKDLDTAFRILTILIKQEKATFKDIVSIDLRFPERVILKLSTEGQAYFKMFRDAKKT